MAGRTKIEFEVYQFEQQDQMRARLVETVQTQLEASTLLGRIEARTAWGGYVSKVTRELIVYTPKKEKPVNGKRVEH